MNKRNNLYLFHNFIFIMMYLLFLSGQTVFACDTQKIDELFETVEISDSERVPLASQPKVVKVGYFYNDVFHQGQSDDEIKKGYGYEYYQMIANYTGWQYEYVYGTWQDVYSKFLAGEIDIIDDISITAERKELMNFSTLPMGEEHYYLFVLEDNTSIDLSDVKTLDGKKIGVNGDSLNQILLQKFMEDNDLNIEIVACSGVEERMEKLQSGKIDGMVTTGAYTVNGIKPTFRIGYADFYFAVNKSRKDLLDELNNALKKIYEQNPNYNNQLRDKYQQKTIVRNNLEKEELDWLKNHPVIRVGYRKNTLPLSDYNYQTNETVGLLVDLLDEFSKNLNVKFETIPYVTNQEMIDDMKDEKLDCIFPIIDNVWFSEKMGYSQTFAVSEEKMAFLYIGDYKGLDNYKKYGYVEGSPAQLFYILENNLTDEYVAYDSIENLLMAVINREVDCTIMNASGWNYISKTKEQFADINSVMLDNVVRYSFAVARDNPALLSILENSVAKVDKNIVLNSLYRNSQLPEDYSLENFIKHNLETTFFIIFVIVIIIITGVIFYIRNKMANEYLSYSSEHDGLTGVYNRTAFNRLINEIDLHDKICFAMIDIDHFKNINDTYGHDIGDEIIKKVANQLLGVVRSNDKVVRFGGDEFALILYGMTIDNKEVILKKIASVISKLQNPDDGLPVVSISVGVAFSESGYCKELFERADEALYTTKENGRNGCIVWDTVIKE